MLSTTSRSADENKNLMLLKNDLSAEGSAAPGEEQRDHDHNAKRATVSDDLPQSFCRVELRANDSFHNSHLRRFCLNAVGDTIRTKHGFVPRDSPGQNLSTNKQVG